MTEARIKQYMRMAIQAAEKARGKALPILSWAQLSLKNDTVTQPGLDFGIWQ